MSEAEFPTVAHVWLAQERRGAQVAWAPVRDGMIDPAEYDTLIDERTAVVSACHGYYLNGFIQDAARIAARARDAGALSFVDAYQTLGAVPVDVRAIGVDFLASGNLKFLMGIPGIAFLYVRPEIVESLHPSVTGWFGRANPFAFDAKALDWAPTASRFDSGTPPVINAYVARAGMEIINAIGPAADPRVARGARPAPHRGRPCARPHAARTRRHGPQDGDDGVRRARLARRGVGNARARRPSVGTR